MRNKEKMHNRRAFLTLTLGAATATIPTTMRRASLRRYTGAFLLASALLLIFGCTGPIGNRPPVAIMQVLPTEGYSPLSVQCTAAGSYDPDGDSLTYAWDFGDGETANGPSAQHTFIEGSYEVSLEVSDGRGGIDTETRTIVARAVPEGMIARHYTWEYAGKRQDWALLIPWDLYQTYRARIRNTIAGAYAYGDYVADPLDDPTLEDYATALWNRVDGNRDAFVECALAFVQGAITYRADPPTQEWPLYPLETLFDGVGDCEDTSILLVSLLRARGVSSSLAFVDTDDDGIPDHVLVLVPVTTVQAAHLSCQGQLLLIGGIRYAVAETAVEGAYLPLGCDPWGLSPGDVAQRWSF
jgi:PKD repeat protein